MMMILASKVTVFSSSILLASFLLPITVKCKQDSYSATNPNRIPIRIKNDLSSRSLQESNTTTSDAPNFSVKYVGQFQHLRDSFCLEENPVLYAYCRGQARFMSATETVQCTELAERDEYGWSQIRCVNTCVGTSCQDVYLALDSSIQEGPYGSIYFECYGDTIDDVDALFNYAGLEEGTCASTASGQTRNYHVIRLGVMCQEEYILDDYYVECGGTRSISTPSDSLPGMPGDALACETGNNCQGESCTFSHNDTVLFGITENFLDCVNSVFPIEIAEPNITEASPFKMTSTFQATWGIFFDELSGEKCNGNTPTIQLLCTNWNSKIKYLNSTSGTVNCNQTSMNSLACTDSGTSFVNQFTGVIYECSGPEIPTTSIEYPELEAFCDGNTVEATVSHKVQLSVYCSIIEDYFFDDLYVECGSLEHEFQWLDEFGADYGNRYTCSETVTFGSGSTSSDIQKIPKLTMTTDQYWEDRPDSSCFSLENAQQDTTVPESTLGPTPAPTPKEPNFRASYLGQFQNLRDQFCVPESPVIQALCHGNIEFVNATATVECTHLSTTDSRGWSQIECINTCVGDSECSDVYLALGIDFQEGPYGEVYFECYGDNIEDVEAEFLYLDSGDGSCAAVPNEGDTRTFHVARLGVLCPNTGDSDYSFDDYYFECDGFGAFSVAGDADIGSPGHDYTCVFGDNCQGEACTVDHETVILYTHLSNFQDECVDAKIPIPVSEVTSPPGTTLSQAIFQVTWGLFFGSPTCTGNTPSVRISCTNGNIQFLKSTSVSVSCSKIDDSTLQCSDTGSSFVDRYTDVSYSCTSAFVPQTLVEYPEQEAFCDGNSAEATVSHKMQLGAYCDLISDFLFDDWYFECGDVSNTFSWADEFDDLGSRYTCSEIAYFATGSTASDVQTIPLLSMKTDDDWQDESFGCIRVAAETPPPTTVAPTTVSPTTVSPTTVSPTTVPPTTMVLTTFEPSTLAPTAPTTTDPFVVPKQPSEEKESSSSNVGAAVGGSIAAVLFVGVAVFLAVYCYRRKLYNKPTTTVEKTPPDETGSDTGRYLEDATPMSTPQRPQQHQEQSPQGEHIHVEHRRPTHPLVPPPASEEEDIVVHTVMAVPVDNP